MVYGSMQLSGGCPGQIDRFAVKNQGRQARLTRPIPSSPAVPQCESHTRNSPTLQADELSGHFESYPLAGGRKRPHESTAGCAVDAESNLVCPPIGAVFPGTVVPLKHHFTRE